jgi:glycosyltransferase involved in cell wall biosynthesis
MIKVLSISMGETFGGIERLELDWMKYINNKVIDFNILVPNDKTFKYFESEIKKNKVHYLNGTRKNMLGRIIYDIRLIKYLRKNKYDIVHINSSAFFYSFRVLLISKLCGIKKVIVHSHTRYDVNILKRLFIKILNPLYRRLADNYISCSEDARISLFTNSFIKKNNIIVLKNGIDINKYKFNIRLRNKYIKKYNLKDKIVYGHSGRFTKQKNQLLLIDIFNEIHKMNPNSVLLLMGDGELRNQIINKINDYHLNDNVILTGIINNVNELLNCIDVFIFPSLYEGLGISIIESQVNGITTFASTNVPHEANITNLFNYFNIDDNPKTIAKRIVKTNINNNRKTYYNIVKESEYDVIDMTKSLESIYINTYNK